VEENADPGMLLMRTPTKAEHQQRRNTCRGGRHRPPLDLDSVIIYK